MIRELLRDPDTRGWVLLVSNLVGGFLGSRLTLTQVRRAARVATLSAVGPIRAELVKLKAGLESHEKFRGRLVRFLLAKRRHT